MAKEKKTPHLDKWKQTAKSIGKGVSFVGGYTLEGITPGIKNAATTTIDVARDTRTFISQNKSKMSTQMRAIQTTVEGRSAKQLLSSAFDDIKNGTFSIGKVEDSSYDTMDDFEDSLDGFKIDYNDPASVSIGESKKNTAILGKVIAEGNSASIEGMKHMTNTLSAVTLKSAEASTNKISNIALLGFNQTQNSLAGINSRLDTINTNLVSMMEFQNNNIATTNEATIQYFQQTTEVMDKLGAAISEIHDTLEAQKGLANPKKSLYDDFDFSDGFDANSYKEMVIKNIQSSPIGLATSMLGMVKTMSSMGGGIGDFIFPSLFGMLVPKNIKKSLGSLDKTFNHSINDLLYNIGDFKNDPSKGAIARFLGGILGKQRDGIGSLNMGSFKKDAMSWNGVAQKTLVEVIPSYLSNIESALTKKQARIYDMNTGLFTTKKDLKKEFNKKMQDAMEGGMTDFRFKLNELIEDGAIKEADVDKISKDLNANITSLITGNGRRKDLLNSAHSTLSGITDAKTVNELMMSIIDSVDTTVKRVNDLTKSIEEDEYNGSGNSVYRSLFNEKGRSKLDSDIYKKRSAKINYMDKSSRFTSSGINIDSMSEEERKKYEEEQKFNDEFNGKIDTVKAFVGKIFKGDHKYDKKAAEKIDKLSDWIFRKANGFTIEDLDDIMENESSSVGAASSSASIQHLNANSSSNDKALMSIEKELSKETLTQTMKKSQRDIENESALLNDKIDRNDKSSFDPHMNTSSADINSESNTNNNLETSVGILVSDLHGNVLKPFAGVFGEKGFFSTLLDDQHIKETRKKLFDEKDGMFGGVTLHVNDTLDKIKHTFTGEEYTSRIDNTKVDADENNVASHLTGLYDNVRTNIMTHIFGEDYKDNETYQKFFNWTDFKAKRDKKFAKKENTDKADIVSIESPTESITNATSEVATKITDAGDAIVENLIGDTDEESSEKMMKENNKFAASNLKKHLPKTLASGVAGSLFGTIVGSNAGIIGSMFLPGGPITGAIAGIGISLLSRSEGVKDFLFGKEDENKERVGGLITKSTQNFFKKHKAAIIGGGALGLTKSLILGSGGGVLGMLFGGPIAGAMFTTGLSLLKNNEKINKILFGEKDEDGKRVGGKLSKAFSKSKHFLKGAGKGLAIGGAASIGLKSMGLIGASLGPAGIIGSSIIGLGIGIASQTDKFKTLLFGEEEFDKDGNSKGRYGGLLNKVQNMLVVKVFEPIKTAIDDKVVDFAYWAKDKIVYPFRLAFGPIIDSFKNIKKNIEDSIKNAFNNIAETVGNALKGTIKVLFSPLTSTMKVAGKLMLGAVTTGTKLALTPLTGLLKVMQFATLPKRVKEQLSQGKTIFGNVGSIIHGVRDRWANEDDSRYGNGIGGFINKRLTHIRDLGQGFQAANYAYEKQLEAQGYNTFKWRNIHREKADDKKQIKEIKNSRKARRKIDAYRKELQEENKYNDARYSDEKLEKIKANFEKLGINPDWIETNEDLNQLLYKKHDWKEKHLSEDKTSEEYIRKNGIKINESAEVKSARDRTRTYQEKVLSKFDYITKEFAKLAARDSMKKYKNVDINSVKYLDKNLKDQGLTWDDVGIDPSDIVDVNSISNEDWDSFLYGAYQNGDLKDSKNLFTKAFRESLDKENALRENIKEFVPDNAVFTPEFANKMTEKFNEAGFNFGFTGMNDFNNWFNGKSDRRLSQYDKDEAWLGKLHNIVEELQTNNALTATTAGIEGDLSVSDVNTIAGRKFNAGQLKFIAKHKANKEKAERLAREKVESDKAKSGGISFQDEKSEDDINEADIDNSKDDDSTVFDDIKDKASGALGILKKIFTTKAGLASLGVVGIGSALFGDKLGNFTVNKVEPFIEKTVIPFLGKIATKLGDWWDNNGQKVISSLTDNVVKNMSMIVDAAVKVGWSVITTLGKKAINALAKQLPGDFVPFPDADESTKKTFDTQEEADTYADTYNKNITVDQKTGKLTALEDGIDTDADGNQKRLGNSGLIDATKREVANFAMYKSNRKLTKWGVKKAGKLAKFTLTHFPGSKLVRGTAKLGFGAAKGAKNLGKAGIKGIKSLAENKSVFSTVKDKLANTKLGSKILSKKVGKDVAEQNLKNAAKLTTEALDSDRAGKIKGIKTFLKVAEEKLTKFAPKITKYIKSKSFVKSVKEFFETISKGLAKADDSLLKRIEKKILEKTGVAAGKTVADATVVIGVAFFVYDAATGAMNAAELFGVADNEVDWKMRTVSAAINAIMGIGPVAFVDVAFEVYAMITGNNPKQKFARSLYSKIGSAEKLDEATKKLELETAKYNDAHNTNLTTQQFAQKKSDSNTKWNLWTMMSKKRREKYNKEYGDINSYQVFDNEYNSYSQSGMSAYDYVKAKKNGTLSTQTSTTKKTTTPSANVNSLTNYGPGPKSNTLKQNDPRWGSYKLGKFPNGNTSTMATGGCGPTALSIVADSLGKTASPISVAKYAQANGYIKDGGATSGLFTNGASTMGIASKVETKDSVKSSITKGNPVILSGKSDSTNGVYTEAGHVIVVNGIDKNGNVIVNDPMRGTSSVSMNKVLNGMTKGWSYSNNTTTGYGYGYDTAGFDNAVGFGPGYVPGMPSSIYDKYFKKAPITGYIPGMPSSDYAKYIQNNPNATKTVSNAMNTPTSTNTFDSTTISNTASQQSSELGFLTKLLSVGYANMAALMGKDYQTAKQDFINRLSGNSDAGTDGTSSVTLSGSDYKSQIWNFLTQNAGMTDNAAAGAMGCWEAESHNDPTVVEGYYLGGYPGFEQVSSSESSMDSYTTGILFPAYAKSGLNINKSAYKASDGHYYPGFGLAQWTGPRAKTLKEYAKSKGEDWRQLEGQLDFFYNHSGEFQSRTGLKDSMNAASSAEDAATLFLDGYEMSSSTWHTTSAGAKQNKARRANAKAIYDKYHSGNGGNGISFGSGIFEKLVPSIKKIKATGYKPNWLSIVAETKKQIAAKQLGYSQSRYIDINVGGTSITHVRTDCSGFVSACLRAYGNNVDTNTTGLMSMKELNGFTRGDWPGWNGCQPGDIMVNGHHTEIFAGNKNGQHYVYNCGSDSSCNNPGATVSGGGPYTMIWRPNEAGNVTSLSTSTANTATSSTSSGSILDTPFDNFFSSIADSAGSTIENLIGFGPGNKDMNTPEGWFTNTLNGVLTSGYGKRNSILGSEIHKGIDISANKGTSIKSPINGTVVSNGTDVAGYGNYAVVQDRDGKNHLFAHMNKPVGYGVGDSITKNDIIGEVGSTGKSTGDHLHYEIRRSGNKYSSIDPSSYKYDSDKNLNINSQNSDLAFGSGNRDLSIKNASDKLNIALNTKNVETKLDSLIEVMKTWADRDANKDASQYNQINNTTVAYGNGSQKPVKKKTTKKTKEIDSKSLMQIHNAIASK